MKTRKRFRFVAILVILALLVAGCGPTAEPEVVETEPLAPEEPTAEAPPPSAEEVTLVFSDWHLTEPHWETSLKEAFETYQAQNPNINIELDYVSYADKDTKYATEIGAGAGPDVIHLHAYSLRSFIERGLLMDLTPFIEREGGAAFLKPWYPQTLTMMQYEGAYYAIPADFMSMALFYNTNLYEEAGLDPGKAPTTWDEFLENAQALTRDRDGDGQTDTWGYGTIGAIDPGFELRFSPVLFSHGGDYLNEDYTCSALNTPEAKEAIKFFVEMFTVHGVIPPGVTAQNPGTVREQMGNEQIAMLLGSGWTAPIVDGINDAWDAFEVLEVADVPIKAGTDPEFTTTAWLSAWAINPNTEHPDEAWELIKFITAKEQEQKWFDDARVTSARMDVSEEYEPLLTDKFAKAIAGQLPKAKFVPQIKEWPQIIEAVNSAVQLAFTGDKTPEDALEDAHIQINEILGGECPEGPAAAAPPEPAEEVTLVFSDWHLTEPHWEASLKEAFETYQAQNPNINIELDYVSYADKDTKYATEIGAGAGPDVIHLHAYSLRSFIERGFLLDLTPFIEREGGAGFLKPWYPQTLTMMQHEGAQYAIPGDFMSMALFYNTNLYEEAGLDPGNAPTTWDEFLENAQALTRDRDGDGQTDSWGYGTIGAIDPGFELRFSPVLFSHGGDYLNEDYTCSALNTPEAKEAIKFFVELFTVHGVIPPGVTAQNPGTVREQMGNEQVAMLLGSGWTAPIVDGINDAWDAFEVLEVADVPIKAGTYPEFTTTAWLSAWAMNPNTEHPEEAWELVKFITAKEQEQKWFDDARVTSARMDVSEEYEPLATDKFAKAIAGQLPKAKFVPQIKEWPQIIEAVNSAVQLAFTGDKTPEDALEDAHNQINEILGGEACPGF